MLTQTTEKVTVTPVPSASVQTRTVTRFSLAEFFVSKSNQVIFTIVAIVDLLLALRIVFLLLSANHVGVVSFVVNLTQFFVTPFTGIFTSPSVGKAYLDLAAIVAAVIYLIFAAVLSLLVGMFSSKTE